MTPNPFPGARPLLPGESLVGRQDDVARLMDIVGGNYRVVEFLGPTGIGKSSFLRAGFEPTVREQQPDWGIFSVSDWALPTLHSKSALGLYAEMMAFAFGEGPEVRELVREEDHQYAYLSWLYANEKPDGALGQALRKRRSPSSYSRTVLVLDQFDELLRHEPELGRTFLKILSQALEVFPGSPLVHVISIREDFENELRKFRTGIAEQSLVFTFPLEPLSTSLLGTIVSSSVTGQDVQLASRQLASLWGLATADAERFSSDEAALGLLHVQALLYTIWETAGPGAFLSDTAMRHALRIDDSPPAAEAKAVFLEALPRYIELRLLQIAQDEDAQLADETIAMVVCIVPRLSSAGFKINWSLDDLAVDHLTEFYELHATATDADPHWLLRQCIGAARRANPETAARRIESLLPDDWGDEWMLCGRLKGHPPKSAANQIVQTFLRAVQWLKDDRVGIARTTSRRVGDEIIALVHDGYGQALITWAATASAVPQRRVETTVKATGKQILNSTLGAASILTVKELPRTANLGWLGCNVTAQFTKLVFEDCDFSGTLFNRCTFENVEFRNCLLWGALFRGCTFRGVRIRSDAAPGSPQQRIQALTFGSGCHADGDGVLVRGYSGYGLFVDRCSGGPWVVEDSSVAHVGLFAEADRSITARIAGPNLPSSVSVSGDVALHAPAGCHVLGP